MENNYNANVAISYREPQVKLCDGDTNCGSMQRQVSSMPNLFICDTVHYIQIRNELKRQHGIGIRMLLVSDIECYWY